MGLKKKDLKEYNNVLFFGAGKMAEYIYNQLDVGKKLIGCIDTLDEQKRIFSFFKGFKVSLPEVYCKQVKQGDVAVIICVNVFYIPEIVKLLIEVYGYPEQCIFIPNPYTSFRPCICNDEFAEDVRIPVEDIRYETVRGLLRDERSLELFDMLKKSKTYDFLGDAYEIVDLSYVSNLLWWTEDYWRNIDFNNDDLDNATVFDCGACIGDSIQPICNKLPYKNIYYHAFEPVEKNIEEIKKQHIDSYCKELTIHPCAVGRKTEEKNFVILLDNIEGGYITNNTSQKDAILEKIRIVSLDEINVDIYGRLLIKMDIEGAELDALMGAEKLIREYRPYLSICVHHRKNDIIDIPLYLNSILENYDFYLDGGYHTILNCVPR